MDDRKLKQLVSYFMAGLSDQRVTEEIIDETVEEDSFVAGLDRKSKRRICRILKQKLFITQDDGALITEDCAPWLNRRRTEINWFYWPRLKKFLLQDSPLNENVIATLDRSTDGILDCCGDPGDVDGWSSRGMVIGHVQSGKTTNYAALITKAADAGYKVIILLAGITNTLRSQTQQRIDEYFVGRKSVFNAASQSPLPIIHYGEGTIREPDFGTSRDSDFNRNNAVASASLRALREPKIFVMKKNKSVLENLNTWIRDQAHGGKIDEPLLMIDDEADNASINTHKDPDRSTAINALIRETLSYFNRSTFIGYTATPFANIFIDPETNEQMEHEDLFPRNFIKALDPPTNYCGASKYFSETGEFSERCVHKIEDYQDILPLKHSKSLKLETLPDSLRYAIRAFVLARAIRVLRGDGNKHCTMMVNVSRFNDVQAEVSGKIYSYLEKLKNSISTSARSTDPLSDPHMQDLKECFKCEFSDVEVDDEIVQFDTLLRCLWDAVAPVSIATVNMQNRANPLNYESNKETGLQMIAVGGLALSRGLTLEGLVTTYLLRNVGASDTLMQMARWFGYRPGYEDLCRIYLPPLAIAHYREIHESIEELRDEVNQMVEANERPIDFGLKVRQSPTGIRITAANKMRLASELKLAAGYSGRFVQGHAVFNDQKKNSRNIAAVSKFLGGLGDPVGGNSQQPGWSGVDASPVTRLLESFEFPGTVQALAKLDGRRSLLIDYISDRVDSELSKWDVIVAGRSSLAAGTMPIDNLLPDRKIHPVERSQAVVDKDNGIYRFTGEKQALGDANTPTLGLTDTQMKDADRASRRPTENKYCVVRENPLLIVFPVSVSSGAGSNLKQFTVSLALCLPRTLLAIREHTYQINKVLLNQLRSESEEAAEDDEEAVSQGVA